MQTSEREKMDLVGAALVCLGLVLVAGAALVGLVRQLAAWLGGL